MLYLAASACPLILLLIRAFGIRIARPPLVFALDFILIQFGLAVGILLILVINNEPLAPPTGATPNPGIGVAFIPLAFVWVACVAQWIVHAFVTTLRAWLRRSQRPGEKLESK